MITVERLVSALRAARPDPERPKDPDQPGPRGHAVIPPDGTPLFTDERGCAYLLGVTTRTLRSWRSKGLPPRGALVGRWLYDLEELAALLSSEESGSSRKVCLEHEAPPMQSRADRSTQAR